MTLALSVVSLPAQHLLVKKQRKICRRYILHGSCVKDMVGSISSELAKANNYLGLTETCTVVCMTSVSDIWLGSCGSLLPEFKAKLMSIDGTEVTGYNEPGELVGQSKS